MYQNNKPCLLNKHYTFIGQKRWYGAYKCFMCDDISIKLDGFTGKKERKSNKHRKSNKQNDYILFAGGFFSENVLHTFTLMFRSLLLLLVWYITVPIRVTKKSTTVVQAGKRICPRTIVSTFHCAHISFVPKCHCAHIPLNQALEIWCQNMSLSLCVTVPTYHCAQHWKPYVSKYQWAKYHCSQTPRAHLHVVGMLWFVFDINESSLPTPLYSALVSVSVFMALSTVFHSIKKFSQHLSAFSFSSSGLISNLSF